jgi:hypothetical protein
MDMEPALAAGLSLDLQCSKTFSLAEQLSGVRLIQGLQLTNTAPEAVDGLTIVFEITALKIRFEPIALQPIHGGETLDLSDLPFNPDLATTQELTENEKAVLICTLLKDGETICVCEVGFELLVSNAWKLGAWELYASFITPNHPVISQVCKQVSSTLSELGLRNSLEGYQSGSSQRFQELVKATYQTLSSIGISYIDPPQFWTSGFQRIRLPDQVLAEGLGTCADLTPLAAACLEHIGLSPVVVFVNGHVFPGAFTSAERAPELPALIDDVETVYSLCDAGELVLFDSSEYAANPESGFEGARSKAKDYLSSFVVLVNIYQARRDGYKPLPIRMTVQPDQEGEVLSLAKQILLTAATQNIPVEPAQSDRELSGDDSEPIPLVVEKRFQRWKERLLDLSTRNRLLHIDNIDLSKIAVRYFHEIALQVLLRVAYETREQDEELADAIIEVASSISPDQIRPADFSYQRQLYLGDYFAQLISLLPEPLQEVCGELISEDKDTIIQTVFSKINSALGSRKSAYLALDVPPGLLASLEDLLASGRELTIYGDSLCGEGDEALAITTKELSSGIVRTALTVGCNEALSGGLLYRAGRTLAREGRVSVEESGFSPLYLAFGLLQWKESDVAAPRIAPLILYPIEITLDSRTQRVKITRSKSDPIGNITLVEKLRQDLDLHLDILSDLPADDSGVDLDQLITEIRRAIAGRPGWKVLETSLITSFSFGKFLLWRDLQDNSALLLERSTVRHIATGGRDSFPDPLSNLQTSDLDQAAYSDLPIVLPSDSSQLAAVYSAVNGRSFVLQGPPGTGKSQTIANIIGSAIAKGKTVLFVAEKAAAAEVVARRLRSIGLGEFCLDLHHPDTNSEEVLQSLDQALSASAMRSANWESHCAELERARTDLRELASILHQRHSIGYTLFEMASALSPAHGATQPVSQLKPLELSSDQFAANQREIETFVKQLQSLSAKARTVWEFVGPLAWSLKLDSSLSESLRDLCQSLRSLHEALSPFRDGHLLAAEAPVGTVSQLLIHAAVRPWQPLPPALVEKEWWLTSQDKARSWITRKSTLDSTISSLAQRWSEQAFLDNLSDYQTRIQRLREKNFLLRWILGFQLRREIKRYLRNPRQTFPEILRDLDALHQSRREGAELEEEMRSLEGSLGAWDGNPDSLSALIDRCNQLQTHMESVPDPAGWLHALQSIPESSWTAASDSLVAVQQALAVIGSLLELPELIPVFPPEQSLTEAQEAAQLLSSNLALLRDWCSFSQVWDQFSRSPLGPILSWDIADGDWPSLPSLYKAAILKAWFNHCFDEHVQLREFDPERHDVLLQNFRALESQYLEQSRAFVRAEVVSRMPNRSLDLNGSEISEIKREMVKKRNRLPIRTLFTRIPTLLPLLKPCILASPISVARFLPADGQSFDIVLFDEASQVETHDAIGAIARGNQVIIVGDNKQMPPTNFFSRSVSTSDDLADPDCVDDLESILDESIACNLPEQTLTWHYRSRHQSLIAFSNDRYYSGSLNVFPSSELAREDLGVLWHYQEDGRYQPGIRNNRAEAEALVSFLVQRLKSSSPSSRSFGVVTFSTPQQSLIESLLSKQCEIDPSLEQWFDKSNLEYCFVKNLETVQGDERDEILFSICYGPQKDGKLSMSFGPLNRKGGERRLNVAVTRARTALHVFSSILPEQIDLSRTNALAVRHLREFLTFVRRSWGSSQALSSLKDGPGSLHSDILRFLSEHGYAVDTYVGCGGYRLEFAVRHPDKSGSYLLGVECDGDAYINAATVRDRECLRYSVLTQLGWSLHRVWSIEWLLNRKHEEQRLLKALEAAKTRPQPEPQIVVNSQLDTQVTPLAATSFSSFSAVVSEDANLRAEEDSFNTTLATVRKLGRPYEVAFLPVVSSNFQEFYQASSDSAIKKLLIELLTIEAPMTFETAARRVSQSWSGKSFTNRASERVQALLRQLAQLKQLYVDEHGTLWRSQRQADEWSGFRLPPENGRKLDQIPVLEVEEAMLAIANAALSIDREMLMREAYAALTPYKKLTQSVRDAFEPITDGLLRAHKLREVDGRLFPV